MAKGGKAKLQMDVDVEKREYVIQKVVV